MKNREQGKRDLAGKKNLRLFFALWPDAAVRDALHQLARKQQAEYGGRAMRAETIHLTLLFLGDTPAERLPQLKGAAATVHARAFDLVLEQWTGWRHNGIGYAAPSCNGSELSALSAQLRAAVADAGFCFDQRAFTPHVTLLRKMDRTPPPQVITPVPWLAAEFVLVQSVPEEDGMRYEILGRWPLGSQGVFRPG